LEIECTFDNMIVEVPKTAGADSPRAVWKLNGTVRVKTADVAWGLARRS
jgi:hypothetical protein